MAEPRFPIAQYTSSEFVESAGAVLFHLSDQRICLLRSKQGNVWVLPKGRRNFTESRATAVVREVREETGYSCRLLPITISSRAPPMDEEDAHTLDVPRVHQRSTEPFHLTSRTMGEKDLKLVWWYVAAVNEDEEVRECEDGYERMLVGFEEAVEKLTFRVDRDVVRRAIQLVDTATTITGG